MSRPQNKKLNKERDAALAKGENKFLSTTDCKREHATDGILERYTVGSVCVKCSKFLKNKHRLKNLDREAKRSRERRARDGDAHRAYIRRYMRKYRASEEGRPKFKAAQKKYEQKIRAENKALREKEKMDNA